MNTAKAKVYLAALFGICLFSLVDSLVCYQNLFTDDVVTMDCNNDFTTACGTTTVEGGFIFYHCADKTSTCLDGPEYLCRTGRYNCENTRCCGTDRCNKPTESVSFAPEVIANESLKCSQMIGNSETIVTCMFEGAKCIYYYHQQPTLENVLNGSQYPLLFCGYQDMCTRYENKCNVPKKDQEENCFVNCCQDEDCNAWMYNVMDDETTEVPPRSPENKYSIAYVVVGGVLSAMVIFYILKCLVGERVVKSRFQVRYRAMPSPSLGRRKSEQISITNV